MSNVPDRPTSVHPSLANADVPWATRLPALNMARTPRFLRRIASWLSLALISFPFALGFMPWQQNVVAKGQVLAYSPTQRRAVVKSLIKGVISKWHVTEGQRVKKNEVLAELRDADPELQNRIKLMLVAAREKLRYSIDKADSLKTQKSSLADVRKSIEIANKERIASAKNAVAEAEQAVVAADAAFKTAEINLPRQKILFDKKIISQRKFELVQLKFNQAKAKQQQSQAKLGAKRQDLNAKIAEAAAYLSEIDSKISATDSKINAALGDAQQAQAKILDLQSKQAKVNRLQILSPIDGIVYRLAENANAGEVVKEGGKLVTIVPETEELAVELFVDGNDIPLVRPGRTVRLQFEGWPAVQFAGWPSVAVGTFGGKVNLVDATDNKKGKFRVLIVPDPSDANEWPKQPYLRQGARAKGWILLDRVSLGYEIWRQINGFPQTVQQKVPGKDSFVKKKPK